jgi:putative ABC transport system permease protein
MAIPIIYNIRSIIIRWTSNAVAVLSIAGVVAVFVATLSMARGFEAALVSSGSPQNAMVRRGGSSSEMESVITLPQIKVISDAPGIAKGKDGSPLVSPEVIAIASLPQRTTNVEALVQVRGISPHTFEIRDTVKIVRGRSLIPGLPELIVGKNIPKIYRGFELGSQPSFGGRDWTVVGIMDAGGSAFDSEIWCDGMVLNQTYKRPPALCQSVTARLTSPFAMAEFKNALTADPRLTVQAEREIEYYARQSQMVTTFIRVLGFLVALVMGIGAVFGALNTMYSAISARVREIATMRALGFSEANIIVSFICESLFIALIGGIIGCIMVFPINGYTASTMNWQTFSNIAFAFRITPDLLAEGILFALLMGFIGGLSPSVRAARLPVAIALREL